MKICRYATSSGVCRKPAPETRYLLTQGFDPRTIHYCKERAVITATVTFPTLEDALVEACTRKLS